MQRLGKYELFEPLGRGGYGTVYRARDTALDAERAVKVLHPLLASDPTFIERFQQEARLAARLYHPHIVPVYDLDEDQGRYFLAMKYLAAGSLKDLLAKEGHLPYQRALEIARQIADALDYAHTQGLIHRDIKPGNILLEADGTSMLADFGFARALSGSGASTHSLSGTVAGTPSYMPPEIWDGEAAGPAADIYSLACVFYEMVTGQIMFDGETPSAVMRQHFAPLVFSKASLQNMPAGLKDVLEKALAKEPGERYASAGEFILEVDALLPDSIVQPNISSTVPNKSLVNVEEETSIFLAAPKKHPALLVIGVLIVLFIAVILASVAPGGSRGRVNSIIPTSTIERIPSPSASGDIRLESVDKVRLVSATTTNTPAPTTTLRNPISAISATSTFTSIPPGHTPTITETPTAQATNTPQRDNFTIHINNQYLYRVTVGYVLNNTGQCSSSLSGMEYIHREGPNPIKLSIMRGSYCFLFLSSDHKEFRQKNYFGMYVDNDQYWQITADGEIFH